MPHYSCPKTLLENIARASEKAARLARAFKLMNSKQFELLVQEKGVATTKTEDLDFKTLADVLIQEIIRYSLTEEYPTLGQKIRGEEQMVFTNTLGETVNVEINHCQENTLGMLKKILPGHGTEAQRLTDIIHSKEDPSKDPLGDGMRNLNNIQEDISVDDLGVLIDPIDGTGPYIKGDNLLPHNDPLKSKGLVNVTILIGLFCITTGEVVGGVINQPFANFDALSQEWTGKIQWGLGTITSQMPSMVKQPSKPTAVIGGQEDCFIKDRLESLGFEVMNVPCAGYKMLMVILGYADIYLTSNVGQYPTCYWDTCAGQAILKSHGGGMVTDNGMEVMYKIPQNGKDFENSGLMIAYKNHGMKNILDKLISLQIDANNNNNI